jgi:non-ribosomal peptide synthetase component F
MSSLLLILQVQPCTTCTHTTLSQVVYPADLLRRVLEEAKPAVVLTKAALASRLPDWQCSLQMDSSSDWQSVVAAAPRMPADRQLPTPDSLAYVVMSSGTTGIPKGICCPHRGAVHSYYYRLVSHSHFVLAV